MTNEEVKQKVDSLLYASSFSQVIAALAQAAHDKAKRVQESAPEETQLTEGWHELASKLYKALTVTNVLK